MVVWCTQNAPRWQQFHVAPAMSALEVHHFGEYLKTRYKKLVTHVESHASAMSLLESGEQRHIKAIIINNNNNNTSSFQAASSSFFDGALLQSTDQRQDDSAIHKQTGPLAA